MSTEMGYPRYESAGVGEYFVLCPDCGFDYCHPVGVVVRADENITEVTYYGTSLMSGDSVSGRGVVIELNFYCENGHLFTQCFEFLKGRTYFRYENQELISEEDVPNTIWRD